MPRDRARATGVGAGSKAADETVASLHMRCAWLRIHADLLDDVDPSGQLSAQLYDFADLLEVAHRQGWIRAGYVGWVAR